MREDDAKQMRKTAAGLHCMGYELRDDVGDDELAQRLMEMGDEMERRAAKTLGQRAFRVVLEFEPVYAFTTDEAVEECLGGGVLPEDKQVEQLGLED